MEKLFLFHCSELTEFKIRQTAATLKIPCTVVPDADYSKTLGAIASGKAAPLITPYTKEVPPESLLLLCGLADKRLDKLLAALKRNNAVVDFKAVLTPTNESWTVLKLLLEMHREKAAYEKLTQ